MTCGRCYSVCSSWDGCCGSCTVAGLNKASPCTASTIQHLTWPIPLWGRRADPDRSKNFLTQRPMQETLRPMNATLITRMGFRQESSCVWVRGSSSRLRKDAGSQICVAGAGTVNDFLGGVNDSTGGVNDRLGVVNGGLAPVNGGTRGVSDGLAPVNDRMGRVSGGLALVTDSAAPVTGGAGGVSSALGLVNGPSALVTGGLGRRNGFCAGKCRFGAAEGHFFSRRRRFAA